MPSDSGFGVTTAHVFVDLFSMSQPPAIHGVSPMRRTPAGSSLRYGHGLDRGHAEERRTPSSSDPCHASRRLRRFLMPSILCRAQQPRHGTPVSVTGALQGRSRVVGRVEIGQPAGHRACQAQEDAAVRARPARSHISDLPCRILRDTIGPRDRGQVDRDLYQMDQQTSGQAGESSHQYGKNTDPAVGCGRLPGDGGGHGCLP